MHVRDQAQLGSHYHQAPTIRFSYSTLRSESSPINAHQIDITEYRHLRPQGSWYRWRAIILMNAEDEDGLGVTCMRLGPTNMSIVLFTSVWELSMLQLHFFSLYWK